VGGHSLWFKAFFQVGGVPSLLPTSPPLILSPPPRPFSQAFLPRDSGHISTTKKMKNAGIIGLTVWKGTVNGEVVYRVDENSITKVLLGFEGEPDL
jgi:hypothetical protein